MGTLESCSATMVPRLSSSRRLAFSLEQFLGEWLLAPCTSHSSQGLQARRARGEPHASTALPMCAAAWWGTAVISAHASLIAW
eukprot:1957071-Prymnesium_polylepis.2